MLTDQQKADIIRYLGYNEYTIIPGSKYYSTLISGLLEGYTPEAESIILDLLQNISLVYQQLRDSQALMLSVSIGSIQIAQDAHIRLRSMRDEWISELSSVTAIPNRRRSQKCTQVRYG